MVTLSKGGGLHPSSNPESGNVGGVWVLGQSESAGVSSESRGKEGVGRVIVGGGNSYVG